MTTDHTASRGPRQDSRLRTFLKPFASLKFTVALLAASMLLILVGSLAQARRDVWLVVGEYFRTWVAWIQVKDFFPPSMFPSMIDKDWSAMPVEQFPYPGGWLIGSLLCINLLAAHLYRVRITVKGKRLVLGSIAMIGAVGLTAAIILGGGSGGQLQGEPLVSFDTFWNLLLGTLGVVTLGSIAMATGKFGGSRGGRLLWLGIAIVFGAVFLHYLIGGTEARLANESMRILWQLVLGSIAGSAILAASFLLFRGRAGIIVLHLGIVLLMYSELQVGIFGEEHQLILLEGQTTNFMRDIRERELAIIAPDSDDPSKQQVWVVPEHQLLRAADSGSLIDDAQLPFQFSVPRYLVNSTIRPKQPDDDNPANAGLGDVAFAEELTPVDGVGNGRDAASIYVSIESKTGQSETYMVSQEMGEFRGRFAERIQVGEQEYDLYLRTKRTYLPWSVKLNDVSRTNYIGTSTPKDYRSEFAIVDETGQSREFTTWMNNPVRYAGQTFYQQGYQATPSGNEMTTLQVVRNTGWMLPYIGCMVVAFGMFAQFGQGLVRFLNRTTKPKESQPARFAGWKLTPVGILVPAFITLAMVGWIGRKASPPKPLDNGIKLSEFESMPVAFGGRTLPFGTFSRNSLQSILGKTEFEAELESSDLAQQRDELTQLVNRIWPSKDWQALAKLDGNYETWISEIATIADVDRAQAEQYLRPSMTAKRPASWWMLDTLARPELAARHRVFRIVDDQLLVLLKLEKRPGFAYSLSEIESGLPGIMEIAKETRKLLKDNEAARLTPLQRRVQTLVSEMNRVRGYPFVFNTIQLPEGQPFASLVETWGLLRHLDSQPSVLSTPTGVDDAGKAWQSRVVSDALVRASNSIAAVKADDIDQLKKNLLVGLPRESLQIKLATSLGLLRAARRDRQPELSDSELDAAVHSDATGGVSESDEEIKPIMQLIADAPVGATASQISSELSDQAVAELVGNKPAAAANGVVEMLNRLGDRRAMAMRNQAHMRSMTGIDVPRMLEKQAVDAVVDDLDSQVGDVLFGNDAADSFRTMSRANQAWDGALVAWRDRDAAGFNSATADYQAWLSDTKLPLMNFANVRYESFINQFAPQYYTIFLYLTALVLMFVSWIGFRQPLWRSAMGVMVLAFVVHSFYLLARMQISGRPPVTNLYSSAIFIGWVLALGTIVFEYYWRLGMLAVIGCVSGASTLMIAHFLGIEQGDTLSVMQAVLDTQFWLATHVVCVTIGYAATFLAGMLGVGYLVAARVTRIDASRLKSLGGVIYGTIGFALLFSFVGTVLGGLWADDSWGRFWGWDPKENGALLIVIWNALILHARWDKLVRDNGTAILAVGGNIVTAWSWFGVNELGAGLHSYGFTEGRLLYLAWFVVLNLVLMVIAAVTSRLHQTQG